MKAKIFFFSFLFFGNSLLAQLNVGGGISYSSFVNSFGANAKIGFLITPKIETNFSHIYFRQNDVESSRRKIHEWNGDLRYFMPNIGLGNFYPLIGINYTKGSKWYSSSIPDKDDGPIKDIGVNVGFGVKHNFKQSWNLDFEIKYIYTTFKRLVFSLGISYDLNFNKNK